MLLAIDISNSTIKAGVFLNEELKGFWQVATERQKVTDDYAMLFLNLFASCDIDPKKISGVSISCVVPRLRYVFKQFSKQYLDIDPFIVNPRVKLGIEIGLDYPSEVGGDRIVNALATHKLYGGPAIAIAFGTATVFDCVSEKGEYLGGAIAPGIIGALESLTSKASQLFKVELVRPPQGIGKNTLQAMQSGMIFGFVGLVERLVKELKSEMVSFPEEKVKVIATGGLADVIQPETDLIDTVDHKLTLNGLRLIYDLNK